VAPGRKKFGDEGVDEMGARKGALGPKWDFKRGTRSTIGRIFRGFLPFDQPVTTYPLACGHCSGWRRLMLVARRFMLTLVANFVKYHIISSRFPRMFETTIIKEPILRELVRAAEQVQATALGRKQGFALAFKLGALERTLATAKGSIRMFASLDTAGAFVRNLGIDRFEVDMASHEPGRLRRARPDRAEALRATRTKLQQQPLEFDDAESA